LQLTEHARALSLAITKNASHCDLGVVVLMCRLALCGRAPSYISCAKRHRSVLLGAAERSHPSIAIVARNNPRESAPGQKIHQLAKSVLPDHSNFKRGILLPLPWSR
jgi:hypothetical protein